MLDYTAMDFETANSYRGSPCAVGLVRVRDGEVVDQVRWLMRPPADVDHFDPFNVSIHGITADMVRDEPRWSEMLPRIVDYVGDDVVVAHNARFDVGVIRHACSIDGIASPTVRFLCTLVMARRALSLPSYSLPFVVEALGIRSENHHDPLADATAVAGIVRKLAERASETNLAGLANSLHVAIGWLREGTYGGSASLEHRPGLIHPGVNRDADPDSHLYGRVVVFTGALTSMTRQSAWEECARAGAIPQANTTKRTNVLVVGDVDPAYLRPGATITGKTRKVFELQARGQDIEIMTEDEFLQCLADKPLDPEAANGNGIRGHSD